MSAFSGSGCQSRVDRSRGHSALPKSRPQSKRLPAGLHSDQLASPCFPKTLWKLNWFPRDYGYDTRLLGRDEVDERQLVGLKSVVKISHIVLNGASLIQLDGFAPARRCQATALHR
jgi:hypothetical protein